MNLSVPCFELGAGIFILSAKPDLHHIRRNTMNITFPDGSVKQYEDGMTALQIAESFTVLSLSTKSFMASDIFIS